ncbi:MAG: DivIVA domain-containing protein [Oscillospiraceae bacterium]|nr:DivIVA domain-containing protein [Oscillospiraceae bacterium]MDE7003665.1 DivIVA domain-containing protein [Oscillospiraceae bacterium]
MMTPQEVASHSFAKATLGGYNLAQVDEFLDALTEDYTALYNENAILKNKLKVLSDTVEEYRATDNAMRKTLLAAQKMADDMVADAKRKKQELVGEAEHDASQRVEELQKAVKAEEFRLKKAQESTAAYVRKLAKAHDEELAFLANLGELVPPELAAAKDADPSEDIKAALAAQVRLEEEQRQAQAAAQKSAPRLVAVGPDDDVPPMPDDLEPLSGQDQDDFELDPDATRRYTDLQFGKDYEIQ